MSTIVTRSGKGSPLTHTEMDANLINLNTDKVESSDLSASSGSSLIGFLPSGSGATSTTVQSQLRNFVNASNFGASPAASAATNTVALQAAIDHTFSLGGGEVLLGAGIYNINDTLVLKNKVVLVGQGSSTTEIYVANSANKTAIKSYNYDNLVGTDSWLVDAGEFGLPLWAAATNYSNECVRPSVANGNYYRVKVDAGSSGGTEPVWPTTPLATVVDGGITWECLPYSTFGYGLKNLRIHGNKANQTSGSGVQFYGKRLQIDNVIITSCKDEGWHSEANYSILGAQATNGDDLPEGLIRGLYVRSCGSHGFVWRGQHDSYIESLFADSNAGWGVRFETDTSTPTVYSGNADSGFMHVYANTLGGVYVDVNASHQCAFMISENNFGVGLQCDGWQTKIGQLQLYSNNRSTGSYQAVITGQQCKFPSIHVKQTAQSPAAGGGVQISGEKNTANITAIGFTTTSTGVGVDVLGSYHDVTALVDGFAGAGAIGLRTGNGTTLLSSHIKATLNNCTTLWNNASAGSLNQISINGLTQATQTTTSGSAAATNEQWDVSLYDTDTASNIYGKDFPLRRRVQAQSATAATHTAGATTETTLLTVAIPAGLLGASGRVVITALWSYTNSANNKRMRIRYGATGAAATHAGTVYESILVTTTASYRGQVEIINRSASSQVGRNASLGSGGWGTTSSAIVTSAINTANATEIEFSAEVSNAGESITLESYIIEVVSS
jgi:hypothetical protein